MATRAARRRRFRIAVAVIGGAALLEGSAWAAGRVLQRKWIMYVDPVLAPGDDRPARDYEDYLARRDPELGWPYPGELGGPRYDRGGSIRLPSDAALPGPPLVSLYGDSYVRAQSNVGADRSWPELLARGLGRRVKNFGVSGYGSDQAYLRFRRNRDDRAPVVVLGHMAEDMTRNLTRFRDLTGNGAQQFAFKPRFVAEEAGLRLLPIPRLAPAEYRRLVGLEGPPLGLDDESFLPGGPTGCVRLEPPFALAVARNLGHWRLRARVGRYPEYAPFYEPDHPLRGHQVTAGILRAFAREARAQGRRPIVLLFPGPHDAAWAQRLGRAALFEHLVRELKPEVEVVDFTPRLLAWLGGRDAWSAYRNHHFVPEVEPLVAETVLEAIRGKP